MMRTRHVMDDWSRGRLANYERIINKRRNTQYVEGVEISYKPRAKHRGSEEREEEKHRENSRVYSPPECMGIKICSRE
jgi:hypothetical protein